MKDEIKYFSMFTGVGGFELGFEEVNIKNGWDIEKSEDRAYPPSKRFVCVGFSEIDKYANELLANKFPAVKNWGDAREINPSELPDFDMLCGGFPCQAFSIAGKRRGFKDTRGTLFFEIARILEVKRPKIVLLENVKGLLNHDKGETFKVILQTLEELGYEVQWMVLNSKFFGVPQNRERVFIIGSLRGEPRPEILPFREIYSENFKQFEKPSATLTSRYYKQGNADPYISQLNNPTHSNNRIYSEEGISPAINTAQGGNRQPKIRAVLTPDRENKRQNGRRFKEPGEPSFTITGQDIHGVAIMDLYNNKEHSDRSPALTEPPHNTLRVREGMKIRRLTPTECERLQGFPNNWTEGFSDTQRYKMMGNAVTVNVIREIAKRLLNEK